MGSNFKSHFVEPEVPHAALTACQMIEINSTKKEEKSTFACPSGTTGLSYLPKVWKRKTSDMDSFYHSEIPRGLFTVETNHKNDPPLFGAVTLPSHIWSRATQFFSPHFSASGIFRIWINLRSSVCFLFFGKSKSTFFPKCSFQSRQSTMWPCGIHRQETYPIQVGEDFFHNSRELWFQLLSDELHLGILSWSPMSFFLGVCRTQRLWALTCNLFWWGDLQEKQKRSVFTQVCWQWSRLLLRWGFKYTKYRAYLSCLHSSLPRGDHVAVYGSCLLTNTQNWRLHVTCCQLKLYLKLMYKN